MKRTVFISHSSKDKLIGEAVCRFLETRGIPCWIAPRNVTPGKNYGAAIVEAIDECGVFVLILSGASNKSGQVVREVERAASTNSVIIPLRVEAVQPSRDLEFYVSSSHWLDATEKPFEKHLGTLVEAIKNWQATDTLRERATTDTASSIPTPSIVPTPSRRLRPALMITGAVILLILSASAFFFVFRGSSLQRNQTQTPITTSSSTERSPADATAGAVTTPIIERVIASSELAPQTYLGELKRYGANLALDGDETTAWVANKGGPGEWIKVYFKSPTLLRSVSIYGGYGVDVARYQTNNRVHELRVSFPNGTQRMLLLADKMQLQRFELPDRPVVDSIKLEIVSVYRGTKYDATPISEIVFNRD